MAILKKLKAAVGVMLMILSIIIGVTATGTTELDDLIATIFMYLLFGVLPFYLSFFVTFFVTFGKYDLKNSFWNMLRGYTGITILIPLVLHLADYLSNSKTERVSDPT